ncbi:glucose-responsive transcription factor [Dipodascopsis tothii]|uniref:glucose-responsive transcription factor n=1 Tax=Dipodascopsis tothii TaxID=44089 RepID=UPI0034CDFA6B
MAVGGEATVPRKRSKVSRACDECRRKKIRCDASSDGGVGQCSSCHRVGEKCSFSRVPMKRGPSKGYIKELEDRLNSLENSISAGTAKPRAFARGSTPASPPSPAPTRKRALSSTALDHRPEPLSPPLSARSADGRTLPSIDTLRAASAGPAPLGAQLAPLHAPADAADGGLSPALSAASAPAGAPAAGAQTPATPTWDDAVVDRYYTLIHPVYPVLSHSRDHLRQRLAAADSEHARAALLHALAALVHTFSGSALRAGRPPAPPRRADGPDDLQLALQALRNSQAAPPPDTAGLAGRQRAFDGQLLLLQTMLLLAIDADCNREPAVALQGGARSRGFWIGSALGIASALKLTSPVASAAAATTDDLDAPARLARRAFLVLATLDRWNAVSAGCTLMVPDSAVVLTRDDLAALGPESYHIVRLSCVLGHVVDACAAAADDTESRSNSFSVLTNVLKGELERVRESTEAVWDAHPLLEVVYWHVKLVILRFVATVGEPYLLVGPALRITGLLDLSFHQHKRPLSSPLTHHIVGLAACTFLDLVDIADTREDGARGIDFLCEVLHRKHAALTDDHPPSPSARLPDPASPWERRVVELAAVRRSEHDRGGLERLAAVAVGETGSRRLVHDKTERLREHGYFGWLL